MARNNASWLERHAIDARTVTIKVRYDDFVTITRSHSDEPTRDSAEIVRRAVALLDKTEAGTRPIRLLGAGVYNLERRGESEAAEIRDDPQLQL